MYVVMGMAVVYLKIVSLSNKRKCLSVIKCEILV